MTLYKCCIIIIIIIINIIIIIIIIQTCVLKPTAFEQHCAKVGKT